MPGNELFHLAEHGAQGFHVHRLSLTKDCSAFFETRGHLLYAAVAARSAHDIEPACEKGPVQASQRTLPASEIDAHSNLKPLDVIAKEAIGMLIVGIERNTVAQP